MLVRQVDPWGHHHHVRRTGCFVLDDGTLWSGGNIEIALESYVGLILV